MTNPSAQRLVVEGGLAKLVERRLRQRSIGFTFDGGDFAIDEAAVSAGNRAALLEARPRVAAQEPHGGQPVEAFSLGVGERVGAHLPDASASGIIPSLDEALDVVVDFLASADSFLSFMRRNRRYLRTDTQSVYIAHGRWSAWIWKTALANLHVYGLPEWIEPFLRAAARDPIVKQMFPHANVSGIYLEVPDCRATSPPHTRYVFRLDDGHLATRNDQGQVVFDSATDAIAYLAAESQRLLALAGERSEDAE